MSAATPGRAEFFQAMRRHFSILLILVGGLATAPAAPRPWRSEDGQREVRGEFVSRDGAAVTIRRDDGREVRIPLDQLHPDDRTWLNAQHPAAGDEIPPESAVFDQLRFGDSRAQVLEKLKSSKFVEMTVSETFIGRTGLNGVFKTRGQVGGLDASLYFDWTEDGGLKEISLQTATFPASELNAKLRPAWQGFIPLLTTLHGKPASANPQLAVSGIADGALSGTHLWKLEGGGSAILGPARDGDQYQIVVRFTRQDIRPVPLP